MAATTKADSGEPAYKKWTTIISILVAVLSLCLNVVLGLFNLNLSQAKAANDQKLAAIDLENKNLDNLVTLHDNSIEMEARYLVVSGLAIFDSLGFSSSETNSDQPTVQNRVLIELEPWKERWGGGQSSIENEGGVVRTHGVIYYRISNKSKQTAQRVVLTYKWKDFAIEGESSDYLWELQPDSWSEDSVRLADLGAGQSVVVPLAHVLGTNKYYGRVIMPSKIDWHNPVLQKEESFASTGLAPEDQWISNGLNISVGQ